jgi:hypothetical protein
MKSKYTTCVGPSMHPTLKPGDGIELYTYRAPEEIKVGDVISYPHPKGTTDVVHRIVAIKADGVITRGDNNNKTDPYTVPFDQITGKVITAKRRARRIAIRGGKIGFCVHKLMLFRKYLQPWGVLPFHLLSNLLAASGLFNVFHSALDLKIVLIEKNHQRQRILVSGHKAIGKKPAGSGEWQIRFPYKLFVNKRRLEKGETDP